MGSGSSKAKHRAVFDALRADISSGKYRPGDRVPSEAAIVRDHGVSRITAGRALRDLAQAGLVERIAGSGSFVKREPAASSRPLLFGLVIPDLGETEIFEPICHGIATAPGHANHALLWPNPGAYGGTREEQALASCRDVLSRRVDGVFFAPIELTPHAHRVNTAILKSLQDAGVPTVLLDRRPTKLGTRLRHDLAGIDNFRAGYLATEHLLQHGSRRVAFVAYENQASTVQLRTSGYFAALAEHGKRAGKVILSAKAAAQSRHDAFVCSNDFLAGELMHALLARGLRIPKDARIVGIDDIRYAKVLPVPLTTVHQPVREIGETALELMLDRITRPHKPTREVLLDCSLVIRDSCGAEPARRTD